MYWLLGYCAVMWAISAWSMHEVATESWEELAALPTEAQICLQILGWAVIVFFAPIWMPPTYIAEWRKE